MSYEIKVCDILKGAAMEGKYKGAQRGAKCEEIANELTRRGVKNNKGEPITKGGVSHWLEGRREPNFDTLAELCDMFGVYALMPMRGGNWIRAHPEDGAMKELREAVAERDAIIDDLKARVAELEAALAEKQVLAITVEMGDEKVNMVAAEQTPNYDKKMGVKEWVNPNPKKYSVGMLCQVLAALGGEYLGNNAGLQQKITAMDNDGNRKPISNGAFYRLIEQAKERGLIKVDQEITHKKDENGNQIGKGKKGDKLITLLPNWEYNLGDK
ncbi:protein YffS [Escherichia coli]